MLHPDYQYDPKLITAIIEKILQGADIVLASRMMKGLEAVKNGMPLYKYLCNRVLTKFQNFCFKKHLSEYHTGYRAYRKDVLKSIMYHDFSMISYLTIRLLLQRSQKGMKYKKYIALRDTTIFHHL